MPDTKPKHFQCRHIFVDGHRCGSKCLREQNFCFYHYRSHKPSILPEYRDTLSTFELPALDDRSGIQAAITLIAQRVASGCLDSKRAGLLLYALQTASLNLKKDNKMPLDSDTVDEIEVDEDGAIVAPICEYGARPHEKTLGEIMLEEWNKDEDEEAARKAAKTLAELKRQAAAENFTLPALYAVAAAPTVRDDTVRPSAPPPRRVILSGGPTASSWGRSRRTRHTASPATSSRRFRARFALCSLTRSASSVIHSGKARDAEAKRGKKSRYPRFAAQTTKPHPSENTGKDGASRLTTNINNSDSPRKDSKPAADNNPDRRDTCAEPAAGRPRREPRRPAAASPARRPWRPAYRPRCGR
jgi:hypothetical protein